VIGTLEATAIDHSAQRKTRAAMHAQIAPRVELVTRAPHDEVLAEQSRWLRSAAGEVFDARYRVPVIDEDRIVEHPA
jgi:hypothetical protein